MSEKCIQIDKEILLEYLLEARQLVRLYDNENRKTANKDEKYIHGGVDAVALRLLEKGLGIVPANIKLRHGDVNLLVHNGYISDCGIIYTVPETQTIILKDFTGTTMARFVNSLCDLLYERATNGNEELRAVMVPNIASYATRTKREVQRYLSK